ncbi:hypothetical protein APHAL10511_003038 [Amanita phalloides]|nr:hypothetical protein APHAL10511_003038 [Amanita phalloides]
MSTTQPIALPASHSFHDHPMADGSFPGDAAPFNPASYARHFIGSPISWRPGSFASRFLANSPSAHFPDHGEVKYPKTSSSIDSDRGSIINALNVSDREGELCRNYTCCGLHLNDMHALVEHLEEVHFGTYNVHPQAQMQMSYTTQPVHSDLSTQVPSHPPSHVGSSQVSSAHAHTYSTPFDPDDMELEIDLETASVPQLQHPSTAYSSSPSSGVPTPPDTPVTTPLSTYPVNALPNSHLSLPHIHPLSQPASPMSSYDSAVHVSAASTAPSTRHSSPTGTSTRPNLNLNLTAFQRSTQYGTSSPCIPEEAFNSYARYASDYSACMPGTQYDVNDANAIQASWQQQSNQGNTGGQCVPPALLFSASASTTPLSTPDGSRVPSPSVSGYGSRTLSQSSAPATPCRTTPPSSIPSGRSSSRASSASTSLSRPASSLLLSKPFRCPKPNCNKSYKQANGLKYHMTHGSCNFAPPKDLEHVKDLLERKRRDRERERDKFGGVVDNSCSGGLGRSTSLSSIGDGDDSLDLSNISESELREVEREAEKRMKPFACGVGDCQRRYKNMNGLRYHYQHSGDHGAVGLALLASGQHECLQGQKRNQSNSGSKQSADGDKDMKRTVPKGLVARGSSSMPVSRASSRTGTPQPLQQPGSHYSPTNSSLNTAVTHAQPFTPPHSSQQQLSPLPGHTQAQQLAAAYQQQYAVQLQQQYQQYAHIQAAQIHAQQTQQQQQQVMHAQAVYNNSGDM